MLQSTESRAVDILYVHPAKQEADARYDRYIASPPYPIMPVGIPGLINMLRGRGWAVEGLNLPVELLLQPSFDVRSWLRSRPRPRLALVDLHWYEHSYGAIEVLRAVKSVWPQMPVVLGGLTASHFALEIMERFPEVDYVIRGDAELPLMLLATHHCDEPGNLAGIPNLVYREDGQIHRNPLRYCATTADLDQLDHTTMNWLHHWESYAGLQYSGAGLAVLHDPQFRAHWLAVGRGCIFDCAYCGGSRRSHQEVVGRDGYVLRSPERVVEDIQRLQARGFHQVALSLDLASLEPAWWRAFFRLMREREVRIGLYNEFFQLPPKEFVELLAQGADLAHTEVAISPLSGTEIVRRLNGKSFTNQRLLRTLRTLKRHGVPVYVYFSLNLPGETPQAFKHTLELAEQIARLYRPELLRMLNSCHTLDPASPMYREPEKYGIQAHYHSFHDYYTYCRGTGWQPRFVTRGEHRGFEMKGRPAQALEEMARRWDAFAAEQPCRCYPVPRGW